MIIAMLELLINFSSCPELQRTDGKRNKAQYQTGHAETLGIAILGSEKTAEETEQESNPGRDNRHPADTGNPADEQRNETDDKRGNTHGVLEVQTSGQRKKKTLTVE